MPKQSPLLFFPYSFHLFLLLLHISISKVFAIAITAGGFGGSSTRIQCPEGHYLSRFSSAFDGSERFYKFGCSKFHGAWTGAMMEEKCETTEMASMEGGADVYLSCGSQQYTAGVQIVENGPSPTSNGGGQPPPVVEIWQFLCCWSESVRIRLGDCIETKFINDFRRSSTFSSSAQVIRRWQAMSENGDRRWWLQICPVDVFLAPKKYKAMAIVGNEVRARREVPWEWANSRFPLAHPTVHPFFHRRTIMNEQQQQRYPAKIGKNVNSYAVGGRKKLVMENIAQMTTTTNADAGTPPTTNTTDLPPPTTTTISTTTTTPSTTTTTTTTKEIIVAEKEEEEAMEETESTVDMPKLMAMKSDNSELAVRPSTPPIRPSRLLQFNERTRSRARVRPVTEAANTIRQQMFSQQKQQQKQPISSSSSTTTEQPIDALDYYDMYDENFDKARHLGDGGLLSGVNDFIQSLQDGLTLAQVAFPANVKLQEKNGGPTGARGFHLKIAVTPPTGGGGIEGGELAFSRDDGDGDGNGEKIVDRKEERRFGGGGDEMILDDDAAEVGSFLLQQTERKMGPKPKRPSTTGTKELRRRGEGKNTIESMLQMIGLCQGHPEL